MREITVWRLFECLIDGLSALHFGNELTLVAPGNIYQSRTLLGWDPIIHFDLKPGNSESLKHFCNPWSTYLRRNGSSHGRGQKYTWSFSCGQGQ
jgi:hypothetical protein